MPFAADPGSADVGARMGRAWRELRRGPSTAVVIEEVFGSPGSPDSIEPGQLDVLDLLAGRDDRRMSELAAELRVDPSTITRTVQRLEAAGLVRRHPGGVDGRVVEVAATADGRRLRAVVSERRTAILDAVFDAFEPAERAQLVELLERFVASVDAHAATIVGDGIGHRDRHGAGHRAHAPR